MAIASSDNPMFSVRNLLSDGQGNLSSCIWDAISVDVGVGAVDIS